MKLAPQVITLSYYYVMLLISSMISIMVVECTSKRLMEWAIASFLLHMLTRSVDRYVTPISVMLMFHFPSLGLLLEVMPILGNDFITELKSPLVALNNPFVSFFLKPFSHFSLEYVTESKAHLVYSFDFEDMDPEELRRETEATLRLSNSLIFLVISLSALILFAIHIESMAMIIVVIIFVIVFALPGERDEKWMINKDSQKFPGIDGIYRITATMFGLYARSGVAYVKDGVIQSRLHVTGKVPLYFQGVHYYPTFADSSIDIITWCGAPTYVVPKDNQLVVVEVLPVYSHSTIVYRTNACVAEDGNVFFKGLRTAKGVSGSPYFLEKKLIDESGTETTTLEFAGNIGWNIIPHRNTYHNGTETWQMEILHPSNPLQPVEGLIVQPGQWYQLFSHPGSGKSRSQVPQAILSGLNICRNIIVAGPTRVVAKELYGAIAENINTVPASLYIKGDAKIVAGARVIVTTHASLLSMLMRGAKTITDSTGFIIDETHFSQTKTLAALAVLRNRIAKSSRGFLLEMTATGYHLQEQKHVLCQQSNYPIKEHTFELTDFAKNVSLIINTKQDKRSIVFCSNVAGPSGVRAVTKRLRNDYPDLNVIPLFRGNYNKSSEIIRATLTDPGVVIVTTSISECGANYNVDVCIDSAKQLRFLRRNKNSKVFVAQETDISQSQYIQRRGRVGRRKEGIYYHPSGITLESLTPGLMENEAEVFDLMVFLRSSDLENFSEFPETDEGVILTSKQLYGWLADTTANSISNPLLYKCWFNKNDSRLSMANRTKRLKQTIDGTEQLAINLKNRVINLRVNAWDDRDRKILLRSYGNVPHTDIPSESESEPEMDEYMWKPTSYYISQEPYIPSKKKVRIENQKFNLIPKIPTILNISKTFFGQPQITENLNAPTPTVETQNF